MGLEKIEIPDSIKTVETDAFLGCLRLKEIKIGNGVTKIENSMFHTCPSLLKVEFPDSVTSMGTYIFYNATGLTEVKLPSGIKEITAHMFDGCTSLKAVEIPSEVTAIREYAFANSAVEKITFKGEDKLTAIDKAAFEKSAVNEITLPDSLRSIGEYAFKNADSLTKIEIPYTVSDIGKEAFSGCDSLSEVKLADYSLTTVNNSVFIDCTALKEIVIPKGVTAINSQAFKNCPLLTEVTVPASVTEIDSTAFSYPAKTTIYGVKGSYAQSFADEGGFKFADITVPCEGFALMDGVESVTVDVGETYRAEFEYYPEDTTDVVALTSDSNKVSITGVNIKGEKTGDTVITAATSSGLTYEFTVHVRDASKLEMIAAPEKTEYLIGEELDLAGIKLQAVYNDGSVAEITDYSVSGYDKDKEGTQTVTLTYTKPNGKTVNATFTVNVIDNTPKVNAIRITRLPDKLQYLRKESLDTTGMVVEAVYTDGSVKTVTDYTTSGYNALKYGEHTVTVKYGDFTATFTVEVVEEIHVHTWGDWYVALEPTYDSVGTERRDCTSCDGYETRDISALPRVPVLSLDGYDIRITLAEDMTYIRYASGTLTTSSDIKNAPDCVTLDAKTIGENTADGCFVKNFPEGGVYSFWVKLTDGSTYIFNCDMADMEQVVTTSQLDITVENLYGVKDIFFAKGDYNSYSELKGDYLCCVTSTKIAGAHSFTYTVAEEALYTVLVRYDNADRDNSIFKVSVTLHTHSYTSSVTVIPTCMGEGLMTYTCDCGDSYTEILPATGEHQWRDWIVDTEPTYVTEGEEIRTCETCDTVDKRSVPVKEYVNRFTDVKANAWYADAVSYVVMRGFMNGMSDTLFAPNGKITREQFVLILANIAGVDVDEYKSSNGGFSDIKANQWYTGAVVWAAQQGYVSGVKPGVFGRGQAINRASLARLLYLYAQSNGMDVSDRADLSGFADRKKIESWMADGIEWAVAKGIISGMNINGQLCVNPKGTATRAQAAVMLRAFDQIK